MMNGNTAAIGAAVLLILAGIGAGGDARAAGPYDGRWTGQAKTQQGNCSPRYDIGITIADGAVRGTMMAGDPGPWPSILVLSGKIPASGQFEWRAYIGANMAIFKGRITGTQGAGSWSGELMGSLSGDSCVGTFTLTKAAG